MLRRLAMFAGAAAIAAPLALHSAPAKACSGSEPFLAAICMFGGNFAPRGWALTDGQLLPISSNSALFSILGTTFGGDGRTTFGLPDLRGRFAMHAGNGPGLTLRRLGERGGTETNTLTVDQLPLHTHTAMAQSGQGNSAAPGGNVWASVPRTNLYSSAAPNVSMAAATIGNTGGGLPVNNMPPFLVVNYIIALQGIFPSRN